MRGIPSLITDIRKKVFTEVARMAYESSDYTKAEDLPYVIVPGESPLHRESIFLERAIAGERIRLAMGLSLQPVQQRSLLTEGMDHAAIMSRRSSISFPMPATPVPRSSTASRSCARTVWPPPAIRSAQRMPSALSTARAASTRAPASNAAAAPRPAPTTPLP